MSWSFKEILISPSIARCFHASTVCDGKLYLHGGSKEDLSKHIPLNDVVAFDPVTLKLLPVSSKNTGPARSHHIAVALNDKKICIVGGWDGKKRTTDVWIFDLAEELWEWFKPEGSSNPPSGLSSHTCSLLNDYEMIITGREGGVRMQRRFGSVFKLKINMKKKTYSYTELPSHIASRSGHSASLISNSITSSSKQSTKIVVLGGRDSTEADILTFPHSNNNFNQDLATSLHKFISSETKAMISSKPKAVRHHAAISAGDLGIIQGGEIFGKVRDNITSDLFVHDSTATRWWQASINSSDQLLLKRMGHSMAWLNNKLYVVGGVNQPKGNASTSLIEISFSV